MPVIELDASKLVAAKSYYRQLILHSNASEDSMAVQLILKTSPWPLLSHPHYPSLILIASVYCLGALFLVGIYIQKLNSPFLAYLLVHGLSLNWLFLPLSLGLLLGTPIHHYLLISGTITSIKSVAITKIKPGLFVGSFLIGILVTSLLLTYFPEISIDWFIFSLIAIFAIFLWLALLLVPHISNNHIRITIADNAEGLAKVMFGGWTTSILLMVSEDDLSIKFFLAEASTRLFGVISLFILGFYISFFLLEKIQKQQEINSGFSCDEAIYISLLTAGLGASIGVAIMVIYCLNNKSASFGLNLQEQLFILTLVCIPILAHGSLLSKFIIFKPRRIKNLIAQYQAKEEQLIKP